MQIKDVMSTDIKLVHADDTLSTAADRMKAMDVGVLPVVAGDGVIGILTDRDIVTRGVAEQADMTTTPVSSVMTREVLTCHDDEDIAQAAHIMKKHQVRRLVVLNRDKKVTGVLSLGDLVTAHTELGGDILDEVTKPSSPDTASE